MDGDRVVVPPEVRDGLAKLADDGVLDPGARERAIDRATEADLASTARWLERVDDAIYGAAAEGRYVGGDEV